ncbi:MAG TPA: hydrogenase maturation protease, partial [Verrucomicrobiota bacterium]|nr:hydrogenase maturation protease [Verrucomicrobiota bacterium]
PHMTEQKKEWLVLGLGNDILKDDAVGLLVARHLKSSLADLPGVEVEETCEMGLSLLDYIAGYRALVVVDAVQTAKAAPGYLHEVGLEDLKILPLMSPHFLGVGEIIRLGHKLDIPMPEKVKVFAIEVHDAFTLGTELSAPLAEAFPSIVNRIEQAVRHLRVAEQASCSPLPVG